VHAYPAARRRGGAAGGRAGRDGDFSRPGLRLITYGGQWVGGRLGYADNVVVFASLVSAYQS
jgi:hypothetical protein